MSQRLLISKEENKKPTDGIYDCIYTEKSSVENLIYEWCGYHNGFFLGPWKITIRDFELMDQFNEDFKKLGEYIYPLQSFEDVWGVYDDNGNQIHLSQKEENKYFPIMKSVIDSISSEEVLDKPTLIDLEPRQGNKGQDCGM